MNTKHGEHHITQYMIFSFICEHNRKTAAANINTIDSYYMFVSANHGTTYLTKFCEAKIMTMMMWSSKSDGEALPHLKNILTE